MRIWAATIAASLLCFSLVAPASAGPALLFDAEDGKILYNEDQDSLWHPASLTKVMTAYVVFEAIKQGKIKLNDKIQCSLVATLQPPSKVGLNVGATLTVEQSLKAIIVKSANDVTVMLAEAVAGSERAFVERMNATAKRLGMTRTHYVNTNGLPDPDQVTSARDLALLGRAVLRDFSEYSSYWALPDVRIGKIRLTGHNALLKTYPGADGLKTGFTCDSGFNVIASATRDGHKLMAVVLGETSGNERSVRAASLLEHGFVNYGWKQIFNTTNLDNLPMDPAARPVMSVRQQVESWDCGNRKRKKVKVRRKKATKAPTEAKATAKPANATASAPPLKGTVAPQMASEPAAQASGAPQSTQ